LAIKKDNHIMNRDQFTAHLNQYLRPEIYKDNGPNGVQVEGRPEINRVVSGVSACLELFEKAVELNADAVLVHHGLIWNFERPLYRGAYKKRIKILLENEISLYAYHLPLDAHSEVGNNIQIARLLDLTDPQPFGEYNGHLIGYRGKLPALPAETVFDQIRRKINPSALIFANGPATVSSVGVISGGAQKDVKQAVLEGLDLYVTGEVSEHIMHYVREEGIHFVAAGHYATERFGIIALGKYLRRELALAVEFIDIPNPV
jgi:dinuclear metal center YbgI/SA1388 family protein